MSSTPLFVYGTLRDPDVLFAILGRHLPPAQCRPAQAPGFAAVQYPGRVYPALIEKAGAAAEGLLLVDLAPLDLDVLDAFEGDEYRRASLLATADGIPDTANFYQSVIAIAPDAAPWTLEDWTRLHKATVIGAETGTAAALRQRFTARQHA